MTKTQAETLDRQALQFNARLELAADKAVSSKGNIPVRLVARNGSAFDHYYWGRNVHDFAGMSVVNDGTIAIDYGHDDSEIIGLSTEIVVEDGDLVVYAELVPYPENPADKALEVAAKLKAGVPYQASIYFDAPIDGPMVIEEIGVGQQVNVNGRDFVGPGVVFRKWLLRGLAVCPHGADPQTSTNLLTDSSEQKTLSIKRLTVDPTCRQRLTTKLLADDIDAILGYQSAPTITDDFADEPIQLVDAPIIETSQQVQEFLASLPSPKRHVELFGDQGAIWFAAGKSIEDCYRLQADELWGKLASMQAELEKAQALLRLVRGEAEPVAFSVPDSKPAEKPQRYKHLGSNLAMVASAIKLPSE